MNKVFLLGNLTADPEVKTHNENSFTLFTVAVTDGYKDKKRTYFFDCIASGRTGENIAEYFEKGKPICVEGKLYTRKNEETGYSEIKVSIYGFTFINGATDSKKGGGKKGGGKKKQQQEDYDDVPF